MTKSPCPSDTPVQVISSDEDVVVSGAQSDALQINEPVKSQQANKCQHRTISPHAMNLRSRMPK